MVKPFNFRNKILSEISNVGYSGAQNLGSHCLVLHKAKPVGLSLKGAVNKSVFGTPRITLSQN
jgi:hypothetical protein